MRPVVLALMYAVTLASGSAWAHDGPHKIMGTVTAVRPNHLDVKATTGKSSTVTLTDKTRVVRGTSALKPADIRPGDRVVVTARETKGTDGKTTMVASQVQLGAQPAQAARE